jgi:polyisoprenoid-binding protein YceI
VVLVASAVMAAPADEYTSDAAHSSIEFSVKHMVITNVKGTFDIFEAVIMFDPENLDQSSVEVSIDVASVNTRDEKRDEHLRSPDFFDAAKFPAITFKSSKISKKGDGYVAAGTLTIRGVSKEVELPFQLNGPITNPWGQVVMGIELDFKINRKDFGVNWSKTMDNGGLVVGDDVKIEINLEAKKS